MKTIQTAIEEPDKAHSNAALVVWKESFSLWAAILIVWALLIGLYYPGLSWMVYIWNSTQEYGYGYLVPVITLFLIWQKKDQLERTAFDGSWGGFLVVLLGIGLYFIGKLSTLYIITQYAFLVALLGFVIALTGWRQFRQLAVPLFLLVFMIPLPTFLDQGLSARLQLVSSQLGVAIIRGFKIPVYLQGNVIDLGVFKLQVARACSGLRYLFPLMTISFIAAYFFKEAFWKRVLVFLSSIPMTVLMNSFRIGMIGVLVNFWGISQAEGFLHAFEGWAIFMVCIGLLVAEMWGLTKIGTAPRPFRDTFSLEFPAPTPRNAVIQYRRLPTSFLAAAALLVLVVAMSFVLPQRIEIQPQRKEFSLFPLRIDQWVGQQGKLEEIYVKILKFTDYFIGDYTNPKKQVVNLYVAYYASQHAGDSAHSPQTCIPGGGWQITSLNQRRIREITIGTQPLRVNRVIIQKGDDRQLVYYWFEEQGRVLTNEYLVKWYLLWDALTRDRSDGALVRLVTDVPVNENINDADRRLVSFARAIVPRLSPFIPN